jgi:hypothetical protein
MLEDRKEITNKEAKKMLKKLKEEKKRRQKIRSR